MSQSLSKVLISGYCPHGNSGYGIQTKFLMCMLSQKYDIGMVFWDMGERDECAMMTYVDFSISSSFKKTVDERATVFIPRRPLSNYKNWYWDDLSWAIEKFNPLYVVTIHDIWTIETKIKPFDTPMYGWIPIHYDPPEKQTIVNLRNYETIWSLSLWGKGVLDQYHNDVIHIPHTIHDIYFDGVFANVNRRATIRKSIGISDHAYVILMVARNTEESNRKGFNVALSAFNIYKKTKNPLAHLHMHVNINGAIDIRKLATDLHIADYVTCSDQETLAKYAFSDTFVRNLYLMSDVLLCTSAAEGFGLPVIEAQCCGLPVVATNSTALSENVLLGRLSTPAGPLIGNPGSFSQPNVDEIVKDLIHIERHPPTQMERNSVRTNMLYRFGERTVREEILHAIGKKNDIRHFYLPHTLDTYDTGNDILTYDDKYGYIGVDRYEKKKDTFERIFAPEDAPNVIAVGGDGYMLIKKEDGVFVMDPNGNTISAANACMLGMYNDVRVYAHIDDDKKTLKLHHVHDDTAHDITLPSFENKIADHVCMYDHYVYIPTVSVDATSWLYDLRTRTLQRLDLVSAIKTMCVTVKEDEVRVYGTNANGSIVKIIKNKDYSI